MSDTLRGCIHARIFAVGESDEGHFTRMHGVASISRLLKIIGLFCRISSLL